MGCENKENVVLKSSESHSGTVYGHQYDRVALLSSLTYELCKFALQQGQRLFGNP